MKKMTFGYIAIILTSLLVGAAPAQAQSKEFSLQVTPSPLILTLRPGEKRDVELKIRNSGSGDELLHTSFKTFAVDASNGEVKLSDKPPGDIEKWLPSIDDFTIRTGEWHTLHLALYAPEDASYSYNFAIVVERTDPETSSADETTKLHGSLAVFALVNIDKPGATRSFSISTIKSVKKVYEYLPAELDITLKSTGNSSVRPQGNLYIQRGRNSLKPLAVFPINDQGGYILPSSSRTLHLTWADGFPVPKTSDGKTSLKWDFSTLSKLRIGRYTAKLVTIYDDGARDVPDEASITFWVIPWKIILGAIVLLLLLVAGARSLVQSTRRKIKKFTATKNDNQKED